MQTLPLPPQKEPYSFFFVQNVARCSETNEKSIFRFLIYEMWSVDRIGAASPHFWRDFSPLAFWRYLLVCDSGWIFFPSFVIHIGKKTIMMGPQYAGPKPWHLLLAKTNHQVRRLRWQPSNWLRCILFEIFSNQTVHGKCNLISVVSDACVNFASHLSALTDTIFF